MKKSLILVAALLTWSAGQAQKHAYAYSVVNPDGWFHVRIDVRAEKISVYVNGSAKASLVVKPLVAMRGRKIGYWVGNGSGGSWKNLKIMR